MARTEIAAEASLDTTKFQRGLKKADTGVKKFAKSSIASIGRIGAAFAGVSLVKNVLNLGTAAAETASKFRAVFGPATEMMSEKVKELKETIPATTMEMQNALATFGQMARSFGLNTEAANMFSVEMVKMAGDLASFHNMRPEDVFIKLRAAISGEFEPLKQLGIVINETTLKQEALTLGIWDGVGAMSAAQKALTTQSLLVKQMGTAQGDAAATAESAANQIKFLQSQLKDMGAEIGQTVLPAIVQMVEWLAKASEAAKSASEAVGGFIAKSIYGGEADPMDAYRAVAEKTLERQGAFDELPGGRGGTEKRKKMIEELAKSLSDQHDAKMKAAKESSENAEDQEKIEAAITDEITDPKRVEAQEEYNDALKETIEAAGKLQSIQKTSASKTGGTSTGTTGGASTFEGQSLDQAMADAKKQGIRFQRHAGPGGAEMYQRFENGRKTGGLMTKEALESAAANRPKQKAENSEMHLKSIDQKMELLGRALSAE